MGVGLLTNENSVNTKNLFINGYIWIHILRQISCLFKNTLFFSQFFFWKLFLTNQWFCKKKIWKCPGMGIKVMDKIRIKNALANQRRLWGQKGMMRAYLPNIQIHLVKTNFFGIRPFLGSGPTLVRISGYIGSAILQCF